MSEKLYFITGQQLQALSGIFRDIYNCLDVLEKEHQSIIKDISLRDKPFLITEQEKSDIEILNGACELHIEDAIRDLKAILAIISRSARDGRIGND